jgi:two-component system, LytTR family, sensor kinase
LTEKPFISGRFRYWFAGCWLLLSGLQAILMAWYGLSWELSVQDSLLSNVLLAMACWLISNNLYYYRPAQGRYLYVGLWCLFLAASWILVLRYLLPLLPETGPAYVALLLKSLPLRFFIGLLIISWVALMSLLWYTHQDQKSQAQRQTDTEKLAREAELFKLRQQLQPHFLFNSLNSINALIGSQPKEARKMIQQLSDFLRSTLKSEDQQWVTLEEEIQHLALYLEIEKMRFGHRLTTCIDFNPASGLQRLPPMLLQPLVENAIKFGLYDTTEAVSITIAAQQIENNLIISVSNPFDPQTTPPRKGTGFGLHGIRRRLYLIFARQDLLQTQSDQNNIFTTTLTIPQL